MLNFSSKKVFFSTEKIDLNHAGKPENKKENHTNPSPTLKL